MTYHDCAYCKAEIQCDCGGIETCQKPLPQTNEEWAREAEQHAAGCEWVETRAHTREMQTA